MSKHGQKEEKMMSKQPTIGCLQERRDHNNLTLRHGPFHHVYLPLNFFFFLHAKTTLLDVPTCRSSHPNHPI